MGVDAISAVTSKAYRCRHGPEWCPSFCRTFIAKLFEAGFTAEEVKQITGHASDVVHAYRGGQNHQTSLRAAQVVTNLQSGPPAALPTHAELTAAVVAALAKHPELALELMPAISQAMRELKEAKAGADAAVLPALPAPLALAGAAPPAPDFVAPGSAGGWLFKASDWQMSAHSFL